jgi:hypothetical protein
MDALRERGRHAAVLVIGAVIMLFIAGLIEGIFRQTVTSLPIRYAVAGGTALGWIFYFGYVGRRRDVAIRDARAEDAHDAEVMATVSESVTKSLTASTSAAKSLSMPAMSRKMPAAAATSGAWRAAGRERRR